MGLVTNASYEDAQKQRVHENLQRMKELGLHAISKELSENHTRSKPSKVYRMKACKQETYQAEARRSSRVASTPQPNYREVDFDFPVLRRSVGGSRIPKIQRYISSAAMEAAAAAAKAIQTCHPSFIKPLLRSHVSSCFWLGLPKSFCQKHMPKEDTRFLLEDEKGLDWECLYLAHNNGLSGGWRGFALGQNLEFGDVIVFERVKLTKFKLHILRAFDFEQVGPENQAPVKKHTKKMTSKVKSEEEASILPSKITVETLSRKSQKRKFEVKLEKNNRKPLRRKQQR